jgi:hypothetical protein
LLYICDKVTISALFKAKEPVSLMVVQDLQHDEQLHVGYVLLKKRK